MRTLSVETVLVGLVAAVAALVVFRGEVASIRTPFDYDGDGLIHGAWIKNIIEHGWVNRNPSLGAPFGQQYFDYPLGGDNLHFLVLRAMSLVSSDWALVTNVFFLLGFPAAAMTAHVTLRWLGAQRWTSAVGAVLYGFAPIHFFRGADHLFIASYAIVPIGILLALRAATGTLPFTPTAPTGGRWRDVARSWPWLVGLLAVGACGAYYFIFTVLVMGVACALMAWVDRSIRPLVAAGVSMAIAGASFAIGLLPSWWYWRSNGRVDVAQRAMTEQDLFGLRISSLLSPVRYHVFEPFNLVAGRLANPGSSYETRQYLGLIGAVGLVLMMAALVRRAVTTPRHTDVMRGLLSVLVLICIAVSAIGGLSWLGGLVSFSSIRAWGRLSIFISLFVVAWMALGLVDVERRVLAGTRGRRTAGGVVLAVVMVLGIVDQAPGRRLPAVLDTSSANFHTDREYFAGVEVALGERSSVFELPVRRFPEEPATVDSTDYDLLRPYLSTRTLCWSYGGMKYREAEWQQQLADAPAAGLLDDVIAVGFDGVLIDRFGYRDRAASLEREMTALVGSAPIVDPSKRWAMFDLGDVAEERRAEIGEAAMAERARQLLGDSWDDRRECGVGD